MTILDCGHERHGTRNYCLDEKCEYVIGNKITEKVETNGIKGIIHFKNFSQEESATLVENINSASNEGVDYLVAFSSDPTSKIEFIPTNMARGKKIIAFIGQGVSVLELYLTASKFSMDGYLTLLPPMERLEWTPEIAESMLEVDLIHISMADEVYIFKNKESINQHLNAAIDFSEKLNKKIIFHKGRY